MTTRLLLAAFLSVAAVPALASDVSPFYKNQFALTVDEARAEAKKTEATKQNEAAAKAPESATAHSCKCCRGRTS